MSSRSALLLSLFTENKDKTLAFGHEVVPGLFLANRHALVVGGEGELWLKEVVSADAILCCAKEISENVTTLSNSEFGKKLSGGVSLVPMEEADLTTDSYTSTLESQLREAAAIIHSHVSLGRRIVVACKYGYNRSASSVLSYLVLFKETSLINGLETLRRSRPKVYPNIETWPSLLRIEESSCLNNNSSTQGSGSSVTMEEILEYHAWSPRVKGRLH